MLLADVNINPGPTTVSGNSSSLNTLPFDNFNKLNVPSEHDSSDY